MSALVTVWSKGKYARGWDGNEATFGGIERHPVVPLAAALTTIYKADAHFVPYHVVRNGQPKSLMPRLNQEALERIRALDPPAEVLFDVILVDVDAPGKNATEDWHRAEADKIMATDLCGPAGYYQTKGGYRMVWTLPEPLAPEGYLYTLSELRRALEKFGIHADDLHDWTRCYRLPFVVRDGIKQDLLHAGLDQVGHLPWTPPGPVPAAGSYIGLKRNSRSAPQAPRVPKDPGTSGWFADMEFVKVGEYRRFELPAVIPEGERNHTLLRFAGQLRNRELARWELEALVRAADQERCQPPLADEPQGEREIQRIIQTSDTWDPVGAPGRDGRHDVVLLRGTGVELAEVTLKKLEEEAGESLIYDRGTLWTWRGRRWEALEADGVHRLIMTLDGTWYAGKPKADGTPGWQQVRLDQAVVQKVYDSICTLRSRPGWFDGAGVGVAFNNAVLRWSEDGTLLEDDPGPESRVMGALNCDWAFGRVPEESITRFREIFEPDEDAEQKIEIYREFGGLCILGAATKLQQGMILVGKGSNGKGVFQELLGAMFDRDSITAIAPHELCQEYRRARLARSRLNSLDELPDAAIMQSESLKSAISGSLMEGRHIHHSPFEFRPTAGWLLNGNTLPEVQDLSHGFYRRFIVLTFNRLFADTESERFLGKRLIKAEFEQLACWFVEGGLHALSRGHYYIPESSKDELQAWRESADQVTHWVSENTQPAPDSSAWTLASTLYADYRMWAQLNGHGTLNSTRFGKRLATLVEKAPRQASGILYKIQLKNRRARG